MNHRPITRSESRRHRENKPKKVRLIQVDPSVIKHFHFKPSTVTLTAEEIYKEARKLRKQTQPVTPLNSSRKTFGKGNYVSFFQRNKNRITGVVPQSEIVQPARKAMNCG